MIMGPSPHLEYETKINWLEDPLQFRYVRETYDLFAFRSRFPLRDWQESRTHRLIGYVDISVLAKPMYDRFYRRYWYVKVGHDPYPKRSPGEAVKPSSIKPRMPSEWAD
jgi:hypothetical protein